MFQTFYFHNAFLSVPKILSLGRFLWHIAALVGAAVLLILWGWPVSAAVGVDVLLLALLDAALWLVLSRKASVTYCLREYTK